MQQQFPFKKISLFIPNLYGGGAERVFISLANIFSNEGFDVELIVGIKAGQLSSQVNNIKVIDLKSNSIARSILPLTIHLVKNPPDILLAALPHANLAAIIAVKLSCRKMKIICSVHENAFYSFKHISKYEKMILNVLKTAYKFSDGIVAVSQGLLDSQIKFYGDSIPLNMQKIFNPIVANLAEVMPLRKTSGINKGRVFNIISAGRLSIEKDFTTLIKSYSLLSDLNNTTLTIFGEGPERTKLENLIAELNLREHVFLPGFSNDLRKAFIAADLFVMSSIWEGFGNVLVEALAAGCPVISTDCESGPKEILENGKYGKLVSAGNVKEMVKAIEQARVGDIPVYDSKLAIQRFTFHNIGGQYLDFFAKCFNQ